MDLHLSIRHLDGLFDKLTLTDKVVHVYALGTERIEDAMEMMRIAAGLTHEAFDVQPQMFTNINLTSPLKHDWPMLDGAMRMAARNQIAVIISNNATATHFTHRCCRIGGIMKSGWMMEVLGASTCHHAI